MDEGDRPEHVPHWLFGDFDYYVLESANEDETDEERTQGAYEKVGLGLSPSDDVIISERSQLSALREAVDAAIHDVEYRPPEWPVEIGFSKESPSGVLYAPIVRNASRSRLLDFLGGVLTRVDHALLSNGHVHFYGGG